MKGESNFGLGESAVSAVVAGAIDVDFDAVWLPSSVDGTFVARVDRCTSPFGARWRRLAGAKSRLYRILVQN